MVLDKPLTSLISVPTFIEWVQLLTILQRAVCRTVLSEQKRTRLLAQGSAGSGCVWGRQDPQCSSPACPLAAAQRRTRELGGQAHRRGEGANAGGRAMAVRGDRNARGQHSCCWGREGRRQVLPRACLGLHVSLEPTFKKSTSSLSGVVPCCLPLTRVDTASGCWERAIHLQHGGLAAPH